MQRTNPAGSFRLFCFFFLEKRKLITIGETDQAYQVEEQVDEVQIELEGTVDGISLSHTGAGGMVIHQTQLPSVVSGHAHKDQYAQNTDEQMEGGYRQEEPQQHEHQQADQAAEQGAAPAEDVTLAVQTVQRHAPEGSCGSQEAEHQSLCSEVQKNAGEGHPSECGIQEKFHQCAGGVAAGQGTGQGKDQHQLCNAQEDDDAGGSGYLGEESGGGQSQQEGHGQGAGHKAVGLSKIPLLSGDARLLPVGIIGAVAVIGVVVVTEHEIHSFEREHYACLIIICVILSGKCEKIHIKS